MLLPGPFVPNSFSKYEAETGLLPDTEETRRRGAPEVLAGPVHPDSGRELGSCTWPPGDDVLGSPPPR